MSEFNIIGVEGNDDFMDDTALSGDIVTLDADSRQSNVKVSINLDTREIILQTNRAVENGVNQCGIGTTQKISTGKSGGVPLATYQWPEESYSDVNRIKNYLHLGPKEFDVHTFCAEVDQSKENLVKVIEEAKGAHPDYADLFQEAQDFITSVSNCELPSGLEKIRVTTVGHENGSGVVEANGVVSWRTKHLDVAFPISAQGHALTPNIDGGFTRSS